MKQHDPQVGDIYTNTAGWHVLLLQKIMNRTNLPLFLCIYLEDGLISETTIDLFWDKVA